MNFSFNFTTSKSSRKNTKNYYKKGCQGVVILFPDGEYKVLEQSTKEIYKITDKSLDVTNKKIVFSFNLNEPTKIIVYYLQQNETKPSSPLYMGVAPAYKVKGNILLKNGNYLFDITKVYEEIDDEIRTEFLINHKQLIDAYNGKFNANIVYE